MNSIIALGILCLGLFLFCVFLFKKYVDKCTELFLYQHRNRIPEESNSVNFLVRIVYPKKDDKKNVQLNIESENELPPQFFDEMMNLINYYQQNNKGETKK